MPPKYGFRWCKAAIYALSVGAGLLAYTMLGLSWEMVKYAFIFAAVAVFCAEILAVDDGT